MNTSQNERVPILLDLVAEVSRARHPQDVMSTFARGMAELQRDEGYIGLSTRGLAPGQYRVTRRMFAPGDVNALMSNNPWTEALPVHEGGFLGELIASAYPEIIHNLNVTDDPILGDALAEYGSLMAIPLFDDGEALNWAIPLRKANDGFSVEDLEARILEANLVGGTIRTVLLSNRLQEAHSKIRLEVERIASIQKALLPEEVPHIPELEIASSYETFDQAGGDYYDFIPLDCVAAMQERHPDQPIPDDCVGGSNRWGFLIADASGHGPAAAVIMAMIQAILHAMPRTPEGPAEVLDHINHHLCKKRIEGSFVTAFLGIYDVTTGTLTFSRAGHPPPLVKNHGPGGTVARLIDGGGLPLGVIPETTYDEDTIALEPGQSLVLYTDGITEATNPQGEMFGIEGIEASLEDCTGNPSCVVGSVTTALQAHEDSVRPTDDQTLVVIKRAPHSGD